MPGPAPQENALRRDRKDDKATWTTLPRERKGAAPKWPLPDLTANELKQWRREWKRPQAVMWEEFHQEEEVAIYVRTLVASSGLLTDPAQLNALMRMQNNLGLSQPGLMRLRWRIEAEVTAPARTRTDDADRQSAKSRFQVIDGEAAS